MIVSGADGVPWRVGELQLDMVMRVSLLVQDGLGPVPRTQLSLNFSPFSSSTKDSAEQLPAKSGLLRWSAA